MKGLSQVLGLTFVQKYSQLKPETWPRPFVNTAPGEWKKMYLIDMLTNALSLLQS